MIKVKVLYNGDLIESVSVKGHAGFDQFGRDIVCASVSSIVITSVNAIVRLDSDAIKYSDDNGIVVDVIDHNNTVDVILLNMVSLLEELEKQYKKNIIINKEVHSWDC